MKSGQRGEGKFGAIIFIAVVAMVIFAIVKIAPKRINAYEFKDYVKDICLKAPYEREQTPENVRKLLLAKAVELNLPLEDEDLKVAVNSDQASVECQLVIPIDLKVYTYVMKVDCSTTSKGF